MTWFNRFERHIAWIGSIFTIVCALIGLVWFCVALYDRLDKLEGRVDGLEKQMQTIVAAPVIEKKGDFPVENPIMRECAKLAEKAANESALDRSYTLDTMAQLGCVGALKK